jgi:hypothetical protein
MKKNIKNHHYEAKIKWVTNWIRVLECFISQVLIRLQLIDQLQLEPQTIFLHLFLGFLSLKKIKIFNWKSSLESRYTCDVIMNFLHKLMKDQIWFIFIRFKRFGFILFIGIS